MLQLLAVISILWLSLAVSVGFHARGHDRSGILWFTVVAITGIFGIAFYLLAITSNTSSGSQSGKDYDKILVKSGPKVLFTSVIGAVAVFFAPAVWADVALGPNSSLKTFIQIVIFLAAISGAIVSPWIAFNRGWRTWAYLVSFAPVTGIGVGAGLASTEMLFGVFDAQSPEDLHPILGIIGAVICGVLWHKFYQSILRRGLLNLWDRSQEALGMVNSQEGINLSRRKSLGLVGGGAAVLFGGIVVSHEPEPAPVSVVNTTVHHDSESGTVVAEVKNPRKKAVTVELDPWVRVEEVQKTYKSNENVYLTTVDGSTLVLAESTQEIRMTYEPDEAFSLEEFELRDPDELSISVNDE